MIGFGKNYVIQKALSYINYIKLFSEYYCTQCEELCFIKKTNLKFEAYVRYVGKQSDSGREQIIFKTFKFAYLQLGIEHRNLKNILVMLVSKICKILLIMFVNT